MRRNPPSQQQAGDATASPVRRRRKEARPQELLAAALELFVEKGFAATRSEEVAARAGVSKGTVYLYYPSKEELFKAVVRENLAAHIAEGVETAAQHQGSMRELLEAFMHEWWERISTGPAGGISKIMMAEARNFPDLAAFYMDEIILPTHQLVGTLLERGIAMGEFRPVPIAETVQILISPLLQLVMFQQAFGACSQHCPAMDPQVLLSAQLELMLHGLLAEPARAALETKKRSPRH